MQASRHSGRRVIDMDYLYNLLPRHILSLFNDSILDIYAFAIYLIPVIALLVFIILRAMGKKCAWIYAAVCWLLLTAIALPTFKGRYLDLSEYGLITPSPIAVQRLQALDQKLGVSILASGTERDPLIYAALEELSAKSAIELLPTAPENANTWPNAIEVRMGTDFVIVPHRRLVVSNPAAPVGKANLLLRLESELLQASALLGRPQPVIYRMAGPVDPDYPTIIADVLRELTDALVSPASLQSALPDDCSLLIIDAPQADLSADQAVVLAEYLSRGGRLLIMTDYAHGGMPMLNNCLKTFGMSAIDGVVLDPGGAMGGQPEYPMPTPNDNQSIGKWLSSAQRNVLLPLSHAIQIHGNAKSILDTTDSAYLQLNNLEHESLADTEQDISGPFTLAAASEWQNAKVVWLASADVMTIYTDADVGGANADLLMASMRYLLDMQVEPVTAKVLSTVSDPNFIEPPQ